MAALNGTSIPPRALATAKHRLTALSLVAINMFDPHIVILTSRVSPGFLSVFYGDRDRGSKNVRDRDSFPPVTATLIFSSVIRILVALSGEKTRNSQEVRPQPCSVMS